MEVGDLSWSGVRRFRLPVWDVPFEVSCLNAFIGSCFSSCHRDSLADFVSFSRMITRKDLPRGVVGV